MEDIVIYIDFLKMRYFFLLTHVRGLVLKVLTFECIFIYPLVKAAGGKALPCIVDVRDEEQISSAVEKAVEKFGGSAFILR